VSAARVLVVDDEPDAALYLSTLLSDEGFVTRMAGDAPTAAELLASETFDLLILDVQLPGTTGLRLYLDIEADPRFAGLPVIIVTGVATFQLFDRACRPVRAPAAVFEKPVDQERFLATVNSVLAGSR
jgi:two-component system OmpR family response regulator